ncbi:PAS domain S-box protein [Leptospira borgpetersenii str. 200701203]|uniref:PAS domain S-box protein n=1 Tax=Leptospira borgpetersenii str. 200701203 TaxID=1193007 RepID=M3F8H0_LEPBO|nr:PAS domain S-box protein [Leptospira borgpetersenii str. 200701203]
MREFDFQSADFYKFLIERSPELISFHDPDGIFLYVSPSVTSILGYQPEELIGKNPYDYFSPLDKNRIFESSHQPILKGREVEHVEYQFLRKDGKYVWLQTITQSIRDDHETVIALFSTSREYLGLNAILDETEKNRFSMRFVFRKKSFSMRFIIRVSVWLSFL